jgi:hypoxanthine phosphoribosyltransferase
MKGLEKMLMDSQGKLLSYFGVQFLSMENVKDLAKNLADKITKTYSPDLIVGIERGGMYPAYCLAKEMQLPYVTIDVSRSKRYIGNIETDQILLLSRLLKKSQEEPTIKKSFKYKTNTQKALIIDDDCGSMKTLNMAKSHLKEKDLKSKTSVILKTLQSTPDFFADIQSPLSTFIQTNKRFPWCQYSPHFEDYQLWKANHSTS